MKTPEKNLNDKNQSQFKNQNKQPDQLDRDQKYGKADMGSSDDQRSSRDIRGNVANKSSNTASRDVSSIDNLDDTDDEDVY